MRVIMTIVTLLLMVNVVYAIYTPNETANFVLSLTDVWGNPITTATCHAYIYYPNSTIFTHFNLNYDSATGVYSNQFTTPFVYGTYLQVATCNVSNRQITARKTFYVSRSLDILEKRLRDIAENVTLQVLVNITGQIENVTNVTEQKLDFLEDLMIALHSTPVKRQYCIDNKTLIIEKETVWVVRGREIPVFKNETVICQYGCDGVRNECISPPYKRYLIVFSIVLFIFIITMVVRRFV